MSGNIVNRSRPGKFIDIILDEVYNKSVPKPINLHPGYDIEYIIRNCYGFLYPGQFKKMVEIEKIYDNLSIISSYETPQSSGQGVTKTYYDNYKGREITIGYQRPNDIHNSKMAICFDCWKLKPFFSQDRSQKYCVKKSSDQKGILYPEKITPDSLFPRQTGEIFISSLYTKQNNLNHLNQPKGTMLKLGDGTKVTIV
ncbi:unnamed protein product [Rhizophagus irregularis]|nr:unnamed protein product [Rhizophagus irregularis]